MAQNTGTQVIAPIVTPDSNDKFPTHLNAMGQGGYKAVQTLAERDAIPEQRRENGMLCAVLQNNTVYQLVGGTDNAFWTIFTTGAGGATTGAELSYTPSGKLTGDNLQVAIDELEANKADQSDVYTKTEVDNKITAHAYDYNALSNKPDLSTLHSHPNKQTLDKFTEVGGELVWGSKTIGNMVAAIYDIDGDGVVDKAKTISGLTTTVAMLNHTAGLSGNIQAQINALSSGTVFKGEFPTYQNMITSFTSPEQGNWVFITADENHNGNKTQYLYDGTAWIFGGGATNIPDATDTIKGGIKLAGALGNPLSTSETPLLNETGVVAGSYQSPNIVIDEDGRISFAENGTTAFINDAVVSPTETWSSEKLSDDISSKADKNHTHAQLHDADTLGGVKVDMSSIANKRVLAYDANGNKAYWADSSGGRVYVGSRMINGDFRLVAGANTSLFIDEVAKSITINSTAGSGGAGSVPTLTEITHTEPVSAGSSVFLSLDAAFTKYDIRTVEVSNDQNVVVDVEVYDSNGANKRRIYRSNKEAYIYDIVNVPCHDKDESQKIHIQITNYGGSNANVSLVITTTNLI